MHKTFPAGQTLCGVAFQYHMYGTTMGSAVVQTSAADPNDPDAAYEATWTSLWSKSGNQGDQWRQATLYAPTGQTMLRFEYTVPGSGDTGDFALDMPLIYTHHHHTHTHTHHTQVTSPSTIFRLGTA